MIIDFHTHTFPDAMAEKTITLLKSKSKTQPFSDGTTGGLSKKARAAGIDLSIVLPVITNPLSVRKINAFAKTVNDNTEETGVFSFGGMHPDCPDPAGAIKEIKDLGLKGFKIHPAYQQTMIDDPKYIRILELAEENGLIVVTHSGLDIGVSGSWCPPEKTAALIDAVKPTRFVLAHMGGWEQWKDVKKYLCGKNVYFDTSFCCLDFSYSDTAEEEIKMPVLKTTDFVELIKSHGADKILFGTDSPWADQKPQAEFIKSLPLSEDEKSRILYKNAKKLLGI